MGGGFGFKSWHPCALRSTPGRRIAGGRPRLLTFRFSSAAAFHALAGSITVIAVNRSFLHAVSVCGGVRSAEGRQSLRRGRNRENCARKVCSGCSGVSCSGWDPLLRNGSQPHRPQQTPIVG